MNLCEDTPSHLHPSQLLPHKCGAAHKGGYAGEHDQGPVAGAVAADRFALPRHALDEHLAQRPRREIADPSAGAQHGQHHGGVERAASAGGSPSVGAHLRRDGLHDARPGAAVRACEETIDDAVHEQHWQGRREAPEEERPHAGTQCRHEQTGGDVEVVRQRPHGRAPDGRGHVDQQQRQRGREAGGTDGPRIRRQVHAREEEAQPLDDVLQLVQQKGAGEGEAQLEGLDVRRGGARQARAYEKGQRHGDEEERHGPDAQRGAEAVPLQKVLEEERQRDAGEPGAGPHDAVGEALAPGEPLVHVQDAGAVGDGAAERVEDALREDEVAGRLGEGARREGEAHEEQAQHGCPAREAGVHALEAHQQRNVEVHDALGGRSRVRAGTQPVHMNQIHEVGNGEEPGWEEEKGLPWRTSR